MSKKILAFDALRTSILSDVSDAITELEEIAIGDSPIEKLLSAAIHARIKYGSTEYDGVYFLEKSWPEDLKNMAFDQHKNFIVLEPQVQLEGWRVDFIAYAWTNGSVFQRVTGKQEGKPRWRKLIIECDGHEYHERTKEQAAKDRSRDRSYLQHGCEGVFRFTGSEIWRDPWDCADQVFKWAIGGWG